MASSAKKRAVGCGETPDDDTENSSDDSLEDYDDESEEEEEINEVKQAAARPCGLAS